jgi:hypothetical protein
MGSLTGDIPFRCRAFGERTEDRTHFPVARGVPFSGPGGQGPGGPLASSHTE